MKGTIEEMQRRTFGRTGLPVSPLGFGGAPIGLLETDQQQVSTILNQLLDDGVNLIDTAASYAGSEEAIGKAIGHRRNDYVLISKCGRHSDDLPGQDWSPRLISATLDRTLNRLRTDWLDAMLLHSCDLETLKRYEALEALVRARDAGKIRFVGYSGDNEAAAFAAAHPAVAVLETSVSIVDQANIDTVLPVARKHEVGVIAKRPIANAAWRSPESQPAFYREYASDYHRRFQAMNLHLQDLDLDVDPDTAGWAEVALRFTLSQPSVATAIVGTTNPQNARRNIHAAARPPLSDKTIQHIRDAFERARHAGHQSWPALT